MHGKIPRGPRDSASAAALSGIELAAAEAGLTPPDWREEVASCVQNYRSRRGKYNPDLCLPLQFQPSQFEEQRRANRSLITGAPPAQDPVEDAPQLASHGPALAEDGPPEPAQPAAAGNLPVPNARPAAPIRCVHPRKIIEFPRPSAPLRPLHYELAEPVLEAPRILEAPPEQFELLPEVPAITLDEPAAAAARPEEQTARVAAASVARRICCGVLDALTIAAATAIFFVTFWKIASGLPLLRSRAAAMVVLAVPAILWIAYQYCFLVFGHATVGMRVARLEAVSFEGKALNRRARRRRALAMLISLIAAGLGFAWALLDDERLCWHDRISRSYLAAR